MSRMFVGLSVLLVFVTGALTGCSGSSPVSSAPASATTTASPNGKEVKETGCDVAAFDAVTPVKVPHPAGSLSLRKSGKCDRVYWGRFEPDPTNTEGYTVTVQIRGGSEYKQSSEPANSTIAAFTVGAQGKPGDTVVVRLLSVDGHEVQRLQTTVV